MGSSKGKRLKRFLQKVDDRTAIRALTALWEQRSDFLQATGRTDPVLNAEGRYLALLKRLGGVAQATGPQESPKPAFDRQKVPALRTRLLEISHFAPQPRGYAFEKFLKDLFETFGMKPREPFRNTGEQIDGSFILANETYLLEAKWQSAPTGASELHAFHGKIEQKASWTRGLFISNSGFSPDGLGAFGKGKRVICMDGLDPHDLLERYLPFDHVLDRKVRRAAETGRPFARVRDLFSS